MKKHLEATMFGEAQATGSQWVLASDGSDFVAVDAERRQALRRQLRDGELDRLTFRAVTFKAAYPNKNFLRFRDEDLPRLAASYVGAPFLRDHNAREIEARGGTVVGSLLEHSTFLQTVELTVPRDIEAFLNGQIDRFSIGWFYEGITCSICQSDWLASSCPHWPGRKYRRRLEGGQETEVVCELIFEQPTGKEVSAVNAPAVPGTHVRDVLAQLCIEKAEGIGMPDRVPECETNGQEESQAAETAAAELLAAQRQVVLDSKLTACGLPVELQAVVRSGLRPGWLVSELDQMIGEAVAAWAKLEEQRTVRGMAPRPAQGQIGGMLDSLDQVQLALEGLLAGRRPERGVRPLSGIREFYVLMSGDYEMHGVFQPESVGLAAVDSSTMAGLVANALNKVVINQFQQYPRWWEKIVTIEDFATLQQVKWITVGGVGELPSVAEGAAYAEMALDDQTEVSEWVKKGGYLGITLEAIDRDDTRRIMQAGPALARGAYITLSKAIANIFKGTGPTMSDGLSLFHALHNNVSNQALNYAAFDTTRASMRKQTELNSGERLGGLVVPRFLLVPPELEGTAVQLMATELQPGQASFNENVYAAGNTHEARLAAARDRVVVIDFWTDANDWML